MSLCLQFLSFIFFRAWRSPIIYLFIYYTQTQIIVIHFCKQLVCPNACQIPCVIAISSSGQSQNLRYWRRGKTVQPPSYSLSFSEQVHRFHFGILSNFSVIRDLNGKTDLESPKNSVPTETIESNLLIWRYCREANCPRGGKLVQYLQDSRVNRRILQNIGQRRVSSPI